MSLFAQAARNNGDMPEMFGPVFLGLMCVFLVIGIAIGIAFLLTLSKALSHCRPKNRTMEPGQVWLNLIPIFGLIWSFVTVLRVAESLQNEYRDRGWRARGDFGKQIGLAYLILSLLGIIPFIGPVFSLAALVCFVMYWVKIAGFNKELAGTGGRDLDDDDDEEDNRGRGRGRGRDREDDEDDDYDRKRR